MKTALGVVAEVIKHKMCQAKSGLMGVACQIASSSSRNLVPRFSPALLSRSVGKGGTGISRSASRLVGENPGNEVVSSCSEYSLQEHCLLSITIIPIDCYRFC